MEKDNKNLSEFLNSYLSQSNIECFKSCVTDLSSSKVTKEEENCLISCFSKYFYAYSNVVDTIIKENK
jgi:hypothetical protein